MTDAATLAGLGMTDEEAAVWLALEDVAARLAALPRAAPDGRARDGCTRCTGCRTCC